MLTHRDFDDLAVDEKYLEHMVDILSTLTHIDSDTIFNGIMAHLKELRDYVAGLLYKDIQNKSQRLNNLAKAFQRAKTRFMRSYLRVIEGESC